MVFLENQGFNIVHTAMTPFLTFSGNETFFFSKWVQRIIQVKKWSFVQQKRQASRILNEQLFSVLFAVGGEMCRHKNTIGSLLGLPNFISVRALLSLPAKVSLLSKENILVFLRHFHWTGIYILQKIRNYAKPEIQNGKTLPKLNIGIYSKVGQ